MQNKWLHRLPNDLTELNCSSSLDRAVIKQMIQNLFQQNILKLPDYVPHKEDVGYAEVIDVLIPFSPETGELLFMPANSEYPDMIVLFLRRIKQKMEIAAILCDGNLEIKTFEILVRQYRRTSVTENNLFFKALSDVNCEWNYFQNQLQSIYRPKPYDFVFFNDPDRNITGYGIIASLENDRLKMLAYHFLNEEVVYSNPTDLGNISDFNVYEGKRRAFERFNRELNQKNGSWNGHLKRIEPLNFRVNKGEIYYYMTDNLETSSAVEKGCKADTARFRSGNYFREKKLAEIFRDYSLLILQKIHTESCSKL